MSQPIRDRVAILVSRFFNGPEKTNFAKELLFPVRRRHPKNRNLVEHIEFLLPATFLQIPYSGFIGDVENVPAN